jgi:hypothetical protein
VSGEIVDREELEEVFWAIADIRVDVREIHELSYFSETMKRKPRLTEEQKARRARADEQVRKLREFATRRPGARERLESLTDTDLYPRPRDHS